MGEKEKWYSVSTTRILFMVLIPLGIAAIVVNAIMLIFSD